jgi:lipoate---protein ligase
VLRLWESTQTIVVLGRSSNLAVEVDALACQAAQVPILRRPSGGAAILAGPGCLMYSVILRYAGREHLRLIDQAHRHVLGVIKSALDPLIPDVQHLGISDLAIGGHSRKFSGNSLRCKRDYLLYHGTLLYALDLPLIDRFLKMPPRQPEYRAHRPHSAFLTNLNLPSVTLRQVLTAAFQAHEPLITWPDSRTQHLARTRYSQQMTNDQ